MDKKINKQIIAVASVVVVAILGSIFVNIGMDWFGELTKPSQWIPNFVIPIVWTVIYLVASIYLIKNIETLTKTQIWLFIVNGVLNVLWCLMFFTLKLLFLGEIIIIINLIFGYLLLNNLNPKNWLAKLFYIYPIWLSLATALNTCLWILN